MGAAGGSQCQRHPLRREPAAVDRRGSRHLRHDSARQRAGRDEVHLRDQLRQLRPARRHRRDGPARDRLRQDVDHHARRGAEPLHAPAHPHDQLDRLRQPGRRRPTRAPRPDRDHLLPGPDPRTPPSPGAQEPVGQRTLRLQRATPAQFLHDSTTGPPGCGHRRLIELCLVTAPRSSSRVRQRRHSRQQPRVGLAVGGFTRPRFSRAALFAGYGVRHARRNHHRRRGLHAALAAVLGVVLFAGSGFALAYNDIQTNIDRHDLTDYLGAERPTSGEEPPPPIDPAPGEPINVLGLGSDRRDGDVNEEFGATDVGGMRSDTAMIVHISADRERVEMVSIPRDTLVERPSCTLTNGATTPHVYDAMFNSAFAAGGQDGNVAAAAACAIRTVELLTGIYIGDFAVVDFAGFISMVDALGGVPMCLPEPIQDRRAHVDLEAGHHVLDGREALGVARSRYSTSDGSDISRIGRQHELVAAIAREALSKNLLTDSPRLYRFLDAATQSLSTGTQLGSIPTLAGLAYSLRHIDLEGIAFETMPFDWEGPRVRPSAEAEELWEKLRNDEPIDASLTGTGEAPTEEPTAEGEDDAPGSIGAEPTQEPTTAPEPSPTATSICG